jgi:hypothetical protein
MMGSMCLYLVSCMVDKAIPCMLLWKHQLYSAMNSLK